MTEPVPQGPNGNAAKETLQALVGRQLLSPLELLKELGRAGWPNQCFVHPADFMSMAPYFALGRDDEGLYFILANTTIRPKGRDGSLDLSGYDGPDRVVLARPVGGGGWDTP